MRALGITLPRDRTKKQAVHVLDGQTRALCKKQRKRCIRRDVPDDTAAAVEHRPRDEAHETDAAAAVDQVDAPTHLPPTILQYADGTLIIAAASPVAAASSAPSSPALRAPPRIRPSPVAGAPPQQLRPPSLTTPTVFPTNLDPRARSNPRSGRVRIPLSPKSLIFCAPLRHAISQ